MEYRLRINDNVMSFSVQREEEGRLKMIRENRADDVGFSVISPNHLHLIVNGRTINAYIADDGPGKSVIIEGVPYYLEDADRMATVKKKDRQISEEITPPMPAVVVAVLVTPGDRIKTGDPVVIVSAMKMETTLTAPYDGQVAAVNVKDGDKVMPGQILVDIKKGEQSSSDEETTA